jgi:hypothetical protein
LTVIDQDDHLTLWDTATGTEVARFVELEKQAAWSIPLGGQFSPDDRFLILQEPHGEGRDPFFLLFLDVESKTMRARIEGYLSHLMIAKDGKEMALSRQVDSQHIRVERWRLDAGFPDAGPFQNIEVDASEVVISPKLVTFASRRAGEDPQKGDDIQLWDLATGKEKAQVVYRNPDPPNLHLGFSPNGRFLTVDNRGRFGWINSKTTELPPLWDTEAELKQVGAGLNTLHISADDRWLLTLSKSGEVDLHDTATFQKRGTVSVPGDGTFSIAMGQYISPTVWDLYNFTPDSTKVLVTRMDHFEKANPVTDFLREHMPGFKPKEMRWVSRLWDVETARQIATFKYCRQADCASDGKTLVTAHEDGTIKLWDLPSRKPLLAILGQSLVFWFVLLLLIRLATRFVRRRGLFVTKPALEKGAP